MTYTLFFLQDVKGSLTLMKKNVLLLLFCLLLSSCYVNRFEDYKPTLPSINDSEMWIPITTSPIFIDDSVPYTVYTSTDKIVYIYLNNKKQLIYLEHKPRQNTTKQHNISSILTSGSVLKQLTYIEFSSLKIIGFVEEKAGISQFKSYIIHNNFNTSSQYNFVIPEFVDKSIYLHFHTANKGNLLYTDSASKFKTFNLTPNFTPPGAVSSPKEVTTGTLFTDLSRNKNSLALYYQTDQFKTYNFTDATTTAVDPIFGLSALVFSLREANDIWITATVSSKMNIYKITVNDDGTIPAIPLIRSEIIGSKGLIARGENSSSYFLASENAGKIEVSETTDNFNTMESLGVANSTSAKLESVSGIPYLSYVNTTTTTKELTILKYSKKDSDLDNEVVPKAKITIKSTTVLGNDPFSVSASDSTGNNLSYFWSISPREGATVENPFSSTTRITLPPSSSKVQIMLDINDGSRSSSTTQEVTVL